MALFVLLLSSCGGSGRYDGALRRAQSVLNARPDSALLILDSLAPVAPSMSRPTLMRWQLLRTQAQNKCDTVFRSDSLQLALVDYYDRHGTPNERMTAHYLLGRAYYDMNEPIKALSEYQQAVSSADTTSLQCDYYGLTRAYLNQLYVFYSQNLGREILSVLGDARRAAERAHDTLSVILCYEYRAMAYECLSMPDSMCAAGLVASSLFLDHGRREMSARSLAWSIPYHVSHGDYNLARKEMDTYERYSGYFDECGKIEEGREHYYAVKGNYYTGIHEYDSAEFYLRKCLAVGLASDVDDPMRKTFNCWHAACRGLALLYSFKGIPDSVSRYAMLSEAYNDSLHARGSRLESLRMKRMYDYTEHEKNEAHLRKDVSSLGSLSAVLGLVVLLLVLAGLLFFIYWHSERSRFKSRLESLRHKEEVIEMLKDIRVHLASQAHWNDSLSGKQLDDILKENTESNIMQIDQLIQRQKTEIEKLIKQGLSGIAVSRSMENELFSSPAFRGIMEMSRHGGVQPDSSQWSELESSFMEVLPEYVSFLNSCPDLGTGEIRICLLIRMGLGPSSIASLTGNSRSNLSMTRARIYKKLTGKEGNGKDLERYLRSL